jgi:Mn-containing catalase
MTLDRRIPEVVALRQLVVAGNLLCLFARDPEHVAAWEQALQALRETGLPEMLERCAE